MGVSMPPSRQAIPSEGAAAARTSEAVGKALGSCRLCGAGVSLTRTCRGESPISRRPSVEIVANRVVPAQ